MSQIKDSVAGVHSHRPLSLLIPEGPRRAVLVLLLKDEGGIAQPTLGNRNAGGRARS